MRQLGWMNCDLDRVLRRVGHDWHNLWSRIFIIFIRVVVHLATIVAVNLG
jgi:hypothetical protein